MVEGTKWQANGGYGAMTYKTAIVKWLIRSCELQ
jgi:hypothetical protein